MEPKQLEEFKAILETEQHRLQRELAAFAKPDPKMADDWDAAFPAAADRSAPMSHSSQEEQADTREEFESALAQEQSLESRLREVNRALERIRDHTFGRCSACDQPIAPERLWANPAAQYDMVHQPRE